MTAEHPTAPPSDRDTVAYEKRDLSVKGIVTFAVILSAVLVASLAAMHVLFGFFAAQESRQEIPPSPLAASRPAVPEPRLQVNPVRDIRAFRAAEDERLTRYRWVDKNSGTARIPIDRAMELLVERGLSSSAKATGAPATPEKKR